MHCELLVPGLFSSSEALAASAGGERLPGLERLLASGRRAASDVLSTEDWLMRAFGCNDASAAGALTLLADSSDDSAGPGADLWMRIDPVHLRVGRERLALLPGEALKIARDEAESIVESINRHFSAEMTVYPLHPKRWCARVELAEAPATVCPLELAGVDVSALMARGAQDKRWHALLNEIQMLLHDHPVNAAREARGEPAINSVWCWGAGRLPDAAASPWRSLTADEPIALGLARLAKIASFALPDGGVAWLDRLGDEGRQLAVLDALRAPRALGDVAACARALRCLEESWFAPLLDALRRGRIGMVTIHVPEAGVSFETIRADLRRFWRRARPLAAYAT